MQNPASADRLPGRASLRRMARPSVAPARRPVILAAATRAIAERGFDGVRYVDVAEEAGVAVGTVQHYFPSRDALLGAAFLEVNSTAVAREPGPWRPSVAARSPRGGAWP